MEKCIRIPTGLSWPAEEEKGFSLVEVIAALLVVSLLVVLVDDAFVAPSRWTSSANQETMACNLGNSGLEILRSDTTKLDEANQGRSFDDLFPEIGIPDYEMSGEIVQLQSWPDHPFLYTVVVRIIPSEGNDDKCWEFGTVIRKQ